MTQIPHEIYRHSRTLQELKLDSNNIKGIGSILSSESNGIQALRMGSENIQMIWYKTKPRITASIFQADRFEDT